MMRVTYHLLQSRGAINYTAKFDYFGRIDPTVNKACHDLCVALSSSLEKCRDKAGIDKRWFDYVAKLAFQRKTAGRVVLTADAKGGQLVLTTETPSRWWEMSPPTYRTYYKFEQMIADLVGMFRERAKVSRTFPAVWRTARLNRHITKDQAQ